MTVRKSREEAAETREKILDSALEIMSRQPFSKVSLTKIAERVGLSKGAVYWHFKNRNDLLVSLVEDINGRMAELSPDWAPRSEADVRDYFAVRLERARKSRRMLDICRLMMRRFEWPEEVREKIYGIVREKMTQDRIRLEKFFAGRKTEEYSLPPMELATVVSAVFHGLFIAQIDDIAEAGNLARYVDFVLRALIYAR